MIALTLDDGWLQNTTDPYSFVIPGPHSPEAQSFVVMLDAASREYYELNGYDDVNEGGSDEVEVGTGVDTDTEDIEVDAEVGTEVEAEVAPEVDSRS